MNTVKILCVMFVAVFLTACGDSLQKEYESLKTESSAETLEDAKRQADEVAEFVKKLETEEEDGEELPEGLLTDAKILQAKRSLRFAGFVARKKATEFWEAAKAALSSSGITVAQAAEKDPAIKEFEKESKAREGPNDNWE